MQYPITEQYLKEYETQIEKETGKLRTKYCSVDPDDRWESQCDWCGDTGWCELFKICEDGRNSNE